MNDERVYGRAGRRFLAAAMALILAVGSSGSLARGGRRGGGAAADLEMGVVPIDPLSPNTGLPANLTTGLEPVGRITGDGTLSGFGGVPLATGPVVTSQSGEAVTLVTATNLNGARITVGVGRKLGPDGLPPLVALKSVPVPPVPGLDEFVRDRMAAIALGKAFFWDQQVGSDGNACASCHFHAGADSRTKNQLTPGFLGGDTTFQRTATGGGGPNYQLKAADFPFHRLANPLDRNSAILFDTNDVSASQGTFGAPFLSTAAGVREKCGPPPRDEFQVGGIHTRRVEPRNTPTVINAVFNYRNFWDGRANNVFNGVNPFGPRDVNARVLEAQADGTAVWTPIALRNASLASQAVGPALSEFEMSCSHKAFKDLGRKLLGSAPLARQVIHPDDSVFANHKLPRTYAEMVRAAFQPKWWSANGSFDGYSQMESNFSLYWGLAIMLYEATLVSDQAPIDRFVGWPGSPPDLQALTPQELRGLGVFRGRGMCVSCHRGAEFTGAATSLQPTDDGEGTAVETMILGDGTLAVYDNGFYNIGVRPTEEDRGAGGKDPFGNPLSFTRTWFQQLAGIKVSDPLWVDGCRLGIFFNPLSCWSAPDPASTRVAVDGAFKTPSLRNVALTGPYFHNGGRLVLEQVVEFYNRGGDRRGPDGNDTTGFGGPGAVNGGTSNVHPDVHPLNLSPQEKNDLVAFLRHGLTDTRVACEQAPFDHPSLRVPNGHVGDEHQVFDRNHDGLADDEFIALPAVGSQGRHPGQCLRNDDGTSVRGTTATGASRTAMAHTIR